MECCTNSCCTSCCESSFAKAFSQVCPVCKQEGIPVKNFTVRHIVLEEYLPQVGTKDYFLCTNPECDVGYYQGENLFYKQQLRVPIWLKKDANPKYVCYCSRVTEEDIIDAVLKKGAKTLGDACKITGAMTECKCEINNPTGKCCTDLVKEAFDKAMKIKEGKM
ncbi:Csac_0668 family 2Fe-2S cluster-binding (seleno)protein [Caldicellulosiruptor morganii]|uniref:(2Fe-2S)-binding protein n=1 Tax=Caldicellulosiruptor morganii TaxID=1387555 RepID=A0ABY7BMS2_9FIRM|nr:(2Fe-2S)-binding protein [Caldicellulosiruptor morganii]WAM33607.1 (2Fe-2S)-binding protein [Caldicellulosiruptor morganii]